MKPKLLLTLLLALCACDRPAGTEPAPGTETATRPAEWTHGGMVSAAHACAVEAAAAMLERGGHAVDAAIAAHAVLGLVEPESSGLGGSGFLMVYQRGNRTPLVYDGRETAPAGATADMFVVDGQPLGFREAWQTGLSVGVPGTVAMYEAAHEAHGRLRWAELFRPAIELARGGFEVSPKLAGWLERLEPLVKEDVSPEAYAYLYPEGTPMPVGSVHRNPAYAETLARIAEEGASAFYSGEIAAAIAELAGRPPLPGPMTVADIEDYEIVVRDAVCGDFREGRICSAPPPSSGVAQIMIANLYDRLRDDAPRSSRIRAFVDAQRLAYADRDRYVADPAFADVPVGALISDAYLDARAAQRYAPGEEPAAGDLLLAEGQAALYRASGVSTEQPGTSHLSIVDTDGNAVSLTASVGAPFGSLRFTHGFLLNNEMSDFARSPTERGEPVANAVVPGKRPRSSMSPTMVFDGDGGLRMVTGSPGGNSIVAYVAKSILAVLDWEMTAQEAADYPNVIARGRTVRVETAGGTGQALAGELSAAGYDVQESDGENSGLHLIVVHADRLEGAADKRRDGTVAAVD